MDKNSSGAYRYQRLCGIGVNPNYDVTVTEIMMMMNAKTKSDGM